MEIQSEKILKLKIAQVAPLYESVPPQFYGGTERVVSHLTEALVEVRVMTSRFMPVAIP